MTQEGALRILSQPKGVKASSTDGAPISKENIAHLLKGEVWAGIAMGHH